MSLLINEKIDLEVIKNFVRNPLFDMEQINLENTTTEMPFTGVFSKFDGLWYYAAHHTKLNKTSFHIEFGKISQKRGRLSSWIKEAFKNSHLDASDYVIDHINNNMDTITLIYKFVREMESKNATIMVSRDEAEFCRNASDKSGKNACDDRDDMDDYTKVTCHRRDGCYHYNPHQLWTISNYFICKFHDEGGKLLFRFYFYWDKENNNFYQTGGYRWNIKHMLPFNGYQKFINILVSRMFFNRVDTRAIETRLHIDRGGQSEGFINENSDKDKYKTWRIFHNDHSQNQELPYDSSLIISEGWDKNCIYNT